MNLNGGMNINNGHAAHYAVDDKNSALDLDTESTNLVTVGEEKEIEETLQEQEEKDKENGNQQDKTNQNQLSTTTDAKAGTSSSFKW